MTDSVKDSARAGPRIPQAHRVRTRRDRIDLWPAAAMLGLLNHHSSELAEGDRLPLGWHWLYFRSAHRISQLGPDGHEQRGDFLPETGLPRRMWAGGLLRERAPVRIGPAAELCSQVRKVQEKRGKSGRLVFVSVGHEVRQDGRVCVEEDQVIVYREAGGARAERNRPLHRRSRPEGVDGASKDPVATPLNGRQPPLWSAAFLPTPVALFQFSALTWNSHRIHYDHPYVTGREGYPDLLVHGPLTALLLLDAARRRSEHPIVRFRYRALAPLFAGQPISLVGRGEARGNGATGAGKEGEPDRSGLDLRERRDVGQVSGSGQDPASPREQVVEALGPGGTVAMRGWVRYDPSTANPI